MQTPCAALSRATRLRASIASVEALFGERAFLRELFFMRAVTSRRKRFGNHAVRLARVASRREFNLKGGSYRNVTTRRKIGADFCAHAGQGLRIMLSRV